MAGWFLLVDFILMLKMIQLARRDAPAHPPPSLPARADLNMPSREHALSSQVAVYFSDQNEVMAPKSSGLYAFLARTK